MKRLIRAMSLLLVIGIFAGFIAAPTSASTATNYTMDIGDTKYLYPNSSKPVVSALWTTSDANAVQIESQNTSYCKIKVVGPSAQDVFLHCEYTYQENRNGNISICTDSVEYSITVNSDSVSTESSYTMSISPSTVTIDLAKPEEKATFRTSYTGSIPNEWYFQVPDTPNSIAFYRSDSSCRGSNYEDIEIGVYPYSTETPFVGTTTLTLNFFARTGASSSATLRDSASIHVNVICSHVRSNNVIKKDATCTKKGYTTHTCSICGDSYTDAQTDMVDHQYISTGTTAPGKETQVCKCGKSRTANIYGWSLFEGKWYYRDSSGELVKNSWRKDSIGWCYLGKDGAMLTNCWATDSAGWCYIGSNGYAVTNCWKQDSVGWCYLNEEGSMTKNQWLLDGGNWYYLDSNGYMVTGEHYINNTWYAFNESGIWVP